MRLIPVMQRHGVLLPSWARLVAVMQETKLLSEDKLTADIACVEGFEVPTSLSRLYVVSLGISTPLSVNLVHFTDNLPTCRASGPSAGK